MADFGADVPNNGSYNIRVAQMEQSEKVRVIIPLPRTAVGSLTLKNPVLTASGTFGYGVEFAKFGDLRGLGGIVTKGLSLKPKAGNVMPRIAECFGGMLNSIGLQNCGVDYFIEHYLPQLPSDDFAVIANIYGETAMQFAELADKLGKVHGMAGLEVNISCPNVEKGGSLFGQSAREAESVTRAVKQSAGNLPVIVKLSPNVTDIAEIAVACEEAGADAISCINTLSGMAVDLRSRKAILARGVGGFSGAAIKPVALRCVRQVAKAVKIPVIGIGGIYSAQDVLEFILVGAYAVQVGTANFASPDMAFRIAAELPEAMERFGIESLDALRGSLKA